MGGFIAVHVLQVFFPVARAQGLGSLVGQAQGGGQVPFGHDTCMYHQVPVIVMGQRTMPEPVNQVLGIVGIQDVVDGVRFVLPPDTGVNSQQMQVMVAQDTHGPVTQLNQAPECA